MTKKTPIGKILFIGLVVIGVFAAGFGYLNQTSSLRETSAAAEEVAATNAVPEPDNAMFAVGADEIVVGKAEAPITIIDYSSLSCPHCKEFHETTLPELQKEYIDRGKARLVFRHFPLNEPAMRAAMLVECADASARPNFIKALFDMQKDWAFAETFLEDLKRIAKIGGIDSASFDGCVNDKMVETRILQTRQDAATIGQVTSTPSFFVNGVKLEGHADIENFRTAIGGQAQE